MKGSPETIKNIVFDKKKTLRSITSTKKWDLVESDYLLENQIDILRLCTMKTPLLGEVMSVESDTDCTLKMNNGVRQIVENHEHSEDLQKQTKTKLFISEIQHKLNSYKYQDIHKNLYSENLFIPFQKTIELLLKSNLKCYYCKENVNIIYDSVRDMTQWTLERIDNTQGHNKENVEIACLSCNLKRRTMYHERFLFTKQMGIIKKLD